MDSFEELPAALPTVDKHGPEQINRDIDFWQAYIRIIAHRVYRKLAPYTSLGVDDFVQEGFTGLMTAAERYQPDRTSQFSSYAYNRIMGAMYDSFRHLSPVSRYKQQKNKRYNERLRELKNNMGPDYKITRDHFLSDGNEGLEEMWDHYGAQFAGQARNLSLDLPVNNGSDVPNTLMDILIGSDGRNLMDERFEKDFRERFLQEFTAELAQTKPRLHQIFLYYKDGMSIKNIGVEFNITESRVSQIITGDLSKQIRLFAYARYGLNLKVELKGIFRVKREKRIKSVSPE